jgi:hypothetical protein
MILSKLLMCMIRSGCDHLLLMRVGVLWQFWALVWASELHACVGALRVVQLL